MTKPRMPVQISRRTVLRGAGAAIALPWLESLQAWNGTTAARPPTRFAVLFMGNGVNGNHWWAKGSGPRLQLGRSLSPLEPVKRKVNVIDGLTSAPARGRGIHPAQTGGLLSGVAVQRDALRAGVTIDQVLASRLGGATPRRNLVLACEPPLTGCDDLGYSAAYSSHISWATPQTPAAPRLEPARAFADLFGTAMPRTSVLDRVIDASRGLNRRLSACDRRGLDAYLASVREVEKGCASADDIRDRARLMCDIVALAFQSDTTRIASLVLARDLSSLRYPFLDVAVDHHTASHDDLSDGYERITRFHVGQLAYLARKLDAMPEGDGTVLDHSCVLWLSNMWSGWKHDNIKLPVVLAGGLGGTLETGRALDYLHAGDEKRNLSSLYLSIMDRMGVRLERFGDAEYPLL